MLRSLSLAFGAVLLGSALLGAQAQDPPRLAGQWKLVVERTSPEGSKGAFGGAFEITQQPTSIAFVRQVQAVPGAVNRDQPAPFATTTQAPRSITSTESYTTDGAEHELSPPTAPAGVKVMVNETRSYRAAWTTGQLVIVESNKTAGARGGSVAGQLTSVTRIALSLDPDGALVVDRVSIGMMPRPNGPRQAPPVALRSVYKKTR